MTVKELIERLQYRLAAGVITPDTEVVAKFADMGVGGNITSPVTTLIHYKEDPPEDTRVILITDHCC